MGELQSEQKVELVSEQIAQALETREYPLEQAEQPLAPTAEAVQPESSWTHEVLEAR